MRLKHCLWVLGICLTAPVGASAQTVYYSAGKEIRTLDASSNQAPALVHTSPMFVGDLALCAGNPADTSDASKQFLYFVERDAIGGDRISRLDVKAPLTKKVLVNATAETIFTVPTTDGRVGEIRLTINCDVIFATSTGVFQVNGSAPFSTAATAVVTATAGSGLAVAFDGSLRYSDGSALRATSAGFPATSLTPASAIVGVGVANAGDASVASTLSSLSVGALCVSTLNKVTCGAKAGGSLGTTLAAFTVQGSTATTNYAQFFEFLTDDTAIVGTSVYPDGGLGGSGAKFNGILWKVGPLGTTELTRGPKVNGEFMPIVGVAVGPSAASAPPTALGTTHHVNFGPLTFDVVTPSACSLGLKLRQLSWPEVDAKLNGLNAGLPFPKYLLDRAWGSESWVDDVDVVPTGNCGLSATTPAQVFIAQYIDNLPSRAVLHCHANSCAVITEGNFPFSTPDDEGDSALPDNFSDFLTAKIASTGAPILFSSPLSNDAVVKGTITQAAIAAATTHNSTGGLSIRFRICANETCTEYAPAEAPNPPHSGAGLSVTRFDDNGFALAECRVNDEGGANPDRPVFRVGTDGVTHIFNLDTPPEGPPPCQLADLTSGQTGLFGASVFSHGGTFEKATVLFKLIK